MWERRKIPVRDLLAVKRKKAICFGGGGGDNDLASPELELLGGGLSNEIKPVTSLFFLLKYTHYPIGI